MGSRTVIEPQRPRGTIHDRFRWSFQARIWLRRVTRTLRREPDVELHQEKIREEFWARIVLALIVLGYTTFVARWVISNHYGFATTGFDLGIFEQGVWLLSRFEEPFVTIRGLHMFGDHSSFILLLLTPLYWFFSSTTTLLIAQTLALGLAAVPLWLAAREMFRDEVLATLAALAYLAHPAVLFTNFENFHPDSFETPLVFGAFYFLLKRSWGWYMICLIALLAVKEDVPLMTFMLGIYVAIQHDRRIGIITALLSAAWLGTVLFALFPLFDGSGALYAGRVSSDFGGPTGLLKATVQRPWDVGAALVSKEKAWYVWQMGAPLAFTFLLAPGIAVIALLPLFSNLISGFPYQHQIEYHYGTLIVPVILLATVAGIGRVASERSRSMLMVAVAVIALSTSYLWGPIGRNPRFPADPSTPRAAAIRNAIALVPNDAAVSAPYYVVPHLARRQHIYEFPVPWSAQNWADFGQEGQRLPQADLIEYVLIENPLEPRFQSIAESLDDEGFVSIFEANGIRLLHRESS